MRHSTWRRTGRPGSDEPRERPVTKCLRRLWPAFFSAVMLMGATPGAATANTTLVDATAVYPEGPLWQDGKLLFVEYAGPGIKMWDGKRTSIFWRGEHCGASGLIAYQHDHLLVACYDANTIV